LRIVRYIAFFISVFITPLYLSFVTYNHAVVPQPLALNIAAGREGVPFPSVIEVIALSFIMSIVREAGLRMPGSTGYFIGTLAAVLIGQAIVTAGYVSASLIIVIAISTISSFAVSSTTLLYTSRLLNYFYILFSAVLGVFGLTCGFILTCWHLLTLRSFGLPYLYPVIPFDPEQWKDTFVRAQTANIRKRPRILSPYNRNKNRG
jgi:spore germination protein KA